MLSLLHAGASEARERGQKALLRARRRKKEGTKSEKSIDFRFLASHSRRFFFASLSRPCASRSLFFFFFLPLPLSFASKAPWKRREQPTGSVFFSATSSR